MSQNDWWMKNDNDQSPDWWLTKAADNWWNQSGANADGPIGGGSPASYKILVKTDNAGTSSSNQFALPATGSYRVDWGDGVVENLSGTQTHTFPTAGNYVVSIVGGLTAITFNNGGDRLKLLEIQQWGAIAWSALNNAYHGCSNMQITASDLPIMSGVTAMANAFRLCSAMQSFPAINTSTVDNMTDCWRSCTGLTSFPIISLAAGPNLTRAWNLCTGLTSFPTLNYSNVTILNAAFAQLGSASYLPAMVFPAMTNGALCFQSTTLTTARWSQILIDTEAANQNDSVLFHGGNSTYNTAGGVARAALIADHIWTITDGGAE